MVRVDVASELSARRIHEHAVLAGNNLYVAVGRAMLVSSLLRRRDLPAEVSDPVFAAPIGTLVQLKR